MAQKDADLVEDYAQRSLFLSSRGADLEVELLDPPDPVDDLIELYLVEPGALGGSGITYRMRAHDSTEGRYVYWASNEVDSDGSDYGGPGPLTDIVVQNVIGVD